MDSKVLPTAAKRRPPNAGKGRKKGVPNKATSTVREAIAKLADGHADRFIGWLDAVADGDKGVGRPPDPKGAADLYLKAIEYHIPKLARSELTGKDGKDITISVTPTERRL